MDDRLRTRYLKALALVNLADAARETGRGYRTLHAYLRGERRVTHEAARELIRYIRARATQLTAAADALEAALNKEVQ